MKKIILIAGHSNSDPGAVHKDRVEAKLNQEFREILAVALEFQMNDYRLNNYKIVKDCDSLSLKRVINWINGLPNEEERLIFDIHFNKFNTFANGTEVFIPKNYCKNELELGKKIAKSMADVMGIFNRGCKPETKSARKQLAIMRPKGINLLIELCFLDNDKDFKAYQDNKLMVAANIAKIILTHDYK